MVKPTDEDGRSSGYFQGKEYIQFREPGRTANSVRWAMLDPEVDPREHMRGLGFTDKIRRLQKFIRHTKRGDAELAGSYNDAGPSQGVSALGAAALGSMPFDIHDYIFELVNEMPDWIHFKHRKGKLVGFKGGNNEIYTNKGWAHTKLGADISSTGLHSEAQIDRKAIADRLFELIIGDDKTVSDLRKRQGWNESPFFIKLKDQIKKPPVKKRLDWFFFDGSALDLKADFKSWQLPFQAYELATCVLRLDDIYEGIQHRKPGQRIPYFMWSTSSHVEELVILVGVFDKNITPSKMTMIESFMIGNLPEMTDGVHDYGEKISNSENYMMDHITKYFTDIIFDDYDSRHRWINGAHGQEWLEWPVHDKYNIISKWLATPEGYIWLGTSEGISFLASESGWWWLSSKLGCPWLETDQGINWLIGSGRSFLLSWQGYLWANNGQVRKAWLEQDAGCEWKSYYFSDRGHDPSAIPQRPTKKSYPPPDINIPNYFTNFHLCGWRFVMCPRGDDVEVSSPYVDYHGDAPTRPSRTRLSINLKTREHHQLTNG
ncbi:hypothetical protein F4677DRAFT_461928 [Hypoxylon crocopeplum]|nr:hypothetical protein F4677DRAFT_461928 [Hypoxylon crocopeplum]